MDPETNRFLRIRLVLTYTVPFSEALLAEVLEKHDVADVVVLIDAAPKSEGVHRVYRLEYRIGNQGQRNPTEYLNKRVEL